MTCEDIRPLLEAFVDDDISAEERETVAAHLGTCLSCHREANALLTLCESARAELSPIEPERDLWPGIVGRLEAAPSPEPARRPPIAWWLAAAAAIVIALATGLVIQRTSNPPVDSANTVPASLDIALAGWEEEVLEHRAALLASLDRQRDRLPAESIAAVEENLGLIDEAIREIRSALEQNPDNRQLNFLLANAYQQEVQLLKRLNDV